MGKARQNAKTRQNTKGSSAGELLIGAAIVIFLILPLFSAIIEKYILHCKVQIIRDAADIAAISAYNALNASYLGREAIVFSDAELQNSFEGMLASNLKLSAGLIPEDGSVAEGRVTLESFWYRTSGFPATCPEGTVIRRPSVHSVMVIPVKPSLFAGIILNARGSRYIPLRIHVDTDLPVNN